MNKNILDFDRTRVINTIIGLFFVLFASLAAPKLPKAITMYLDNFFVRLLIFSSIAYLATQDSVTAIIVVIAVMISYQSLTIHKITDKVMTKTKDLLHNNVNYNKIFLDNKKYHNEHNSQQFQHEPKSQINVMHQNNQLYHENNIQQVQHKPISQVNVMHHENKPIIIQPNDQIDHDNNPMNNQYKLSKVIHKSDEQNNKNNNVLFNDMVHDNQNYYEINHNNQSNNKMTHDNQHNNKMNHDNQHNNNEINHGDRDHYEMNYDNKHHYEINHDNQHNNEINHSNQYLYENDPIEMNKQYASLNAIHQMNQPSSLLANHQNNSVGMSNHPIYQNNNLIEMNNHHSLLDKSTDQYHYLNNSEMNNNHASKDLTRPIDSITIHNKASIKEKHNKVTVGEKHHDTAKGKLTKSIMDINHDGVEMNETVNHIGNLNIKQKLQEADDNIIPESYDENSNYGEISSSVDDVSTEKCGEDHKEIFNINKNIMCENNLEFAGYNDEESYGVFN